MIRGADNTCALLLIRHGETAWNAAGRYQGHADPPLNRAGTQQAHRLARSLQGLILAGVYSSDLQRAQATAAVVAAGRGLPVRTDTRLRELHFGAWEGLPAATVMAMAGAAWSAWRRDPGRLAPPGGETAAALWQRVRAGLREIVRAHPDGTVAVVTHGGPLRLLLARAAGGHPWGAPPAAIGNGNWLLLTPALIGRLLAGGPNTTGCGAAGG